MNLVILSIAPKSSRIISKDEAKAQIQRALASIKKGIVVF
jgi:hypothetical protein